MAVGKPCGTCMSRFAECVNKATWRCKGCQMPVRDLKSICCGKCGHLVAYLGKHYVWTCEKCKSNVR